MQVFHYNQNPFRLSIDSKSITYNYCIIGKILFHFVTEPLLSKSLSDGSVSRQSSVKLLGQDIILYSRVIHRAVSLNKIRPFVYFFLKVLFSTKKVFTHHSIKRTRRDEGAGGW